MEWKPIESAPRDGTVIIAGCYDGGNSWCSSDMWDYSNNRWLNNWRCHKKLTHWTEFYPPRPTILTSKE